MKIISWVLSIVAIGVLLRVTRPQEIQVAIMQYPYYLEIKPPAVYREWWSEMKYCTGKHTARFDQIRFFVVQGNNFHMESESPGLLGMTDIWLPIQHRIYVSQTTMFNFSVVAHEMVHELGVIGHPDSVFGKEACNVA